MRYALAKTLINCTKYFILDGNTVSKSKQHIELVKHLNPFKTANLIYDRAYYAYLFPYLSASFSTEEKREIYIHHYAFLRRTLSQEHLGLLYQRGIECFKEQIKEDEFTVLLKGRNTVKEYEGSLSLYFKMNGDTLFTASFSVIPGKVVKVADKEVIYIACMQGAHYWYEQIRKATKLFRENDLGVILMRVIEVFAKKFNICTALGVSAANQLSYRAHHDFHKYYSNYDVFWEGIGATLKNGEYVMPLPLPQKDILLIKQNHRNRTRKKRAKLDEIAAVVEENLNSVFKCPVAVVQERRKISGGALIN